MKKLNATFEIESDLAEHQLRIALEGMGAKYVKTLPDTKHLENSTHFKKLQKEEKQAKDNLYKFINNHR